MKPLTSLTALALTLVALPVVGQQPTPAERAAALKATMAVSQMALKQYEWIETTVISLKDEEKSRKQERCFYGTDGKVTKVLLNQPAPASQPRGPLRRRIVENKKEGMTDYMKQAVALVRTYVPPTPALIQAAKDAGKISVDVLQPGQRARLNFRDYHKAGDTLSVEVDLTNNRPLSLTVKTYLENAKDVVNLDARFALLADGTTYADTITLNATAKNLTVEVDNSGYRKAS